MDWKNARGGKEVERRTSNCMYHPLLLIYYASWPVETCLSMHVCMYNPIRLTAIRRSVISIFSYLYPIYPQHLTWTPRSTFHIEIETTSSKSVLIPVQPSRQISTSDTGEGRTEISMKNCSLSFFLVSESFPRQRKETSLKFPSFLF